MQAIPIMEEQTKDLTDVVNTIRRNRTAIIVIAASIFMVSIVIAGVLPSVYRSSATILIEEQDIPSDLVRAAVTTYAVQRIQTISQRVMTRSNLMSIMDRYGLYTREKRTKTTEEIVQGMREDIKLETISADVLDPRSGAPTKATIAFTLSYDGEGPQVTQKVASELTSLFLDENLKNRTQHAEEAYSFLKDEADRLEAQIAEYEKQLAIFKEKNAGNLPELSQVNMQLMERTEAELDNIENQLRAVEERKFYLDAQLAQISPSGPTMSSSGQFIPDPQSRLKALRSDYARALSRYSPDHPDVVRMRREIAALDGTASGGVNMAAEHAKQLESLRASLVAAREKYSDDHPDIIKLKKEIITLEKTLNASSKVERITAQNPDNPAYLTLQAQQQSTVADIRSLHAKREQLKAKLVEYETRLTTAPQIEREYSSITREHDNAMAKFRDIKAKQMEAEVSKQLEKESKGERFSLIDPPAYPEKPVSPNRPMILFLGFFVAIGVGIGYALAKDALENTVSSRNGLASLMGVNPLGVIPYIINDEDRAQRRKTRNRWLFFFVSLAVIALIILHFLWLPLDVAFFKMLRRATRLLGF